MELAEIRAYEYHPVFSTVLMDHWRRFDEAIAAAELKALKKHHPDANAVRIMHSYDAYLRDTDRYMDVYKKLLELCGGLGLGVISCLFNRWHDRALDCGGIYLEHMIPSLSWAYKEGFYAPYLKDVCERFAGDPRIVLWETCNKPYGAYMDFADELVENHLYEKRWLWEIYSYVRKAEVLAPIGISVQDWYGEEELREVAHCCDVLIRSPYYLNPGRTRGVMERSFPDVGKPMIVIGEL